MNTKRSSFNDNKKSMTFGEFEMTLRALDGQSVNISEGNAYFEKNGKMKAVMPAKNIQRDLVAQSSALLMKAKMREVKSVASSATGVMYEADITASEYSQIVEDAMRKNPNNIANLTVYAQVFNHERFQDLTPVLANHNENYYHHFK